MDFGAVFYDVMEQVFRDGFAFLTSELEHWQNVALRHYSQAQPSVALKASKDADGSDDDSQREENAPTTRIIINTNSLEHFNAMNKKALGIYLQMDEEFDADVDASQDDFYQTATIDRKSVKHIYEIDLDASSINDIGSFHFDSFSLAERVSSHYYYCTIIYCTSHYGAN